MKKIFYLVALFAAVMLTACNSDTQTPQGDKTKLWPAGKKGSNLWGFMNKSGELEIAAKFDAASSFSCGWALVSEDKEYMFIDKNLKNKHSVDQNELYDEFFYYNHLRFVDGKLVGMWDKDFSVVIPADYESLGAPTADKLVAFAEDYDDDEGFGYLDFNGKVVIEPEWYYAYDFEDGMAVVVVKKGSGSDASYKYGLINKKGEYLVEPQKNPLYSLGENRIGMTKSSGKVVMCDKNLEEISGSYDKGYPFTCGLARVYKDEKGYGFVNKNGEEIVSCKYSSARTYADNVVFVKKDADSKWEVLDKNGESLFKLKEDEYPSSNFHNGLALVYSADAEGINYRYIDKDGQTVYKWTPGDDEDDDDDEAPRADNWQELDRRSVLQSEKGGLFLNYERAQELKK
ncbi:MAG: WG repeat-containing protein [Paludibacteraceae bacterium]|nr:WG repeat-containing protein [Paludibacteraceae bacterium]